MLDVPRTVNVNLTALERYTKEIRDVQEHLTAEHAGEIDKAVCRLSLVLHQAQLSARIHEQREAP